MSGFSAQKLKKRKRLRRKMSGFSVPMRMGPNKVKKRYSPQIGGVMISHHNIVSPQNGDARGGPPPSLLTPLV